MPSLVTSALFYKKLLEKLDNSFELKLREKMSTGDILFKTEKHFLYGNISNIIETNNPHKLKPLGYKNLDNKYIINHDFDKDLMLINIGIISSAVLNKYLSIYFSSLSGFNAEIARRDIDIIYAKSAGISKNIIKEFDKSFITTFKELDFIKHQYNKQYFFPVGDLYFENALRLLKRLLGKKIRFTKKSKLYNYKAKPGLSDEFINSKVDSNKSFIDIIDIALESAYKESVNYLKGLLL